jgi:flavin-dependent dehydrogenase
MSEGPRFDVVVVGGGPAGSTAARLLAQWGHSVVIVTPALARRGLAECLPPSTRKLFQFLGIQSEIDGAGFFRTAGNTVWWGKSGERIEPYPEGWGYQVLRKDFDRLLLHLARSAGTRIQVGKAFDSPSPAGHRIVVESAGIRAAIPAKFILDCSGRAGVIGRSLRQNQTKSRTVALCGVWRSEKAWRLPDSSHTLVEACDDGWAWSVPVSPAVRYVAFMVDPVETNLVRGKGLGTAYVAELARTRAFRRIFSHATLEGTPWGCDASLYSSSRFCGPGFLLAGDAGAFIDPLSSFGVKKAMASAWVGALVANTCLRHPAMQEAALQFFDEHEGKIWAHHLRQSADWSREAAGPQAAAFWAHRSEAPEPEADEAMHLQTDAARLAFEDLKSRSSIRLRRASGIRTVPRAGIEGREIVMRNALLAPAMAAPLDFVANVDLSRLVELAEHHRHVPDLFEAYNRGGPPVELPHFLTALSVLLAQKILIDRSHG